MLRYIYTFFYYLLAPLISFRWLYKSFQPPQYREPMRERFGFVKKQERPSIWFHSVSMGESIAAINIIEKLLEQNPDLNIVVTTTTPTGAAQIKSALGSRITHYYSPCDLPDVIKRFAKRTQLKALIILETELWPNWLHYLNKADIPIILANARLSQKSAQKYLKVASLSKQMMHDLSQVLAVSEQDGKRYLSLGLDVEKLQVTGNIKYDIKTPELNDTFFNYWQDCPIWIAASTHKGEDEIILKAHQKLLESIPNAKLILIPRHPERFESVAKLIADTGLLFSRRSIPNEWQESSQVLLGDSMGEMMMAYQKANVAFIAGSLANIGGHNAMEPAILAKPILTGAYIHNFQEIFDLLLAENAAKIVENEMQLAKILSELLQNKELAKGMGLAAYQVIKNNQGALDKTVDSIFHMLS